MSFTSQSPSSTALIQDFRSIMFQLQVFWKVATTDWQQNQMLRRFELGGTDTVKSIIFLMEQFGKQVVDRKKFEEGIFSDLRGLKDGVDSTLELARSPFLTLFFKSSCIRTQKKQKVFFWHSVDLDGLFADALERDLKKESFGGLACSVAVKEPAVSFSGVGYGQKPLRDVIVDLFGIVGDEKIEHLKAMLLFYHDIVAIQDLKNSTLLNFKDDLIKRDDVPILLMAALGTVNTYDSDGASYQLLRETARAKSSGVTTIGIDLNLVAQNLNITPQLQTDDPTLNGDKSQLSMRNVSTGEKKMGTFEPNLTMPNVNAKHLMKSHIPILTRTEKELFDTVPRPLAYSAMNLITIIPEWRGAISTAKYSMAGSSADASRSGMSFPSFAICKLGGITDEYIQLLSRLSGDPARNASVVRDSRDDAYLCLDKDVHPDYIARNGKDCIFGSPSFAEVEEPCITNDSGDDDDEVNFESMLPFEGFDVDHGELDILPKNIFSSQHASHKLDRASGIDQVLDSLSSKVASPSISKVPIGTNELSTNTNGLPSNSRSNFKN